MGAQGFMSFRIDGKKKPLKLISKASPISISRCKAEKQLHISPFFLGDFTAN